MGGDRGRCRVVEEDEGCKRGWMVVEEDGGR